MKGYGSFQLAVDATNHDAVMELRKRRELPAKPFPVMVRTHSWNSTGTSVTMDLRVPWCDEVDIPCAWGIERHCDVLVRGFQ